MTILRTFPTVVFCLLGLCAQVGSAGAATINAATCSQAAVQSAVNSASSGDTVIVPAGTCTWSSSVQSTKAIAIKGAGIANTVINSGINSAYGVGIIQYTPSTGEATKTFELSGFTLDGRYGSGCFLANAPDATTAITGLKVHDNKFANGNSRAIILSGLEFGVFYKNQFQDNYIAISSIGSEMAGWNYPLTQGGANYPYFEDNTFNQTIARGGFIVETGRGGRIVFRHNAITNYGGGGGEVFDAHGVNGSYPSDTGTVSAEYYNNNIGLSTSTRVLFHRGGKMIFANNVITGSGYLEMTEYQGWSYCTSAPYPKPQQANNSFYWNNGAPIPSLYCPSGGCTSCNQYDVTFIKPNRDYWLPASGPESFRPGACASNTFYASTDTGVIFKCSPANNWTTYYRPYTYPHPLTGTAGAPSSPTNLRVI
jgi:hypothetical protein